MPRSVRLAGLALLISLFIPALRVAAAAGDPAARPWLEGISLVELESGDPASLHQALETIRSHGGRIGIVSPPSLMIGWIPYEIRDELVGRAGIRDIYVSEVLPGEVAATDRQSRAMVASFNAMARGDYEARLRRRMETTPPQEAWPDTQHGDGLLPDPIDKDAYLENLLRQGVDIESLADRSILYGSNSLYMTGTSTVTVMFVESDGSSTDPDQYTWTDTAVQNYIDGVNAGLLWWSDQANNYSGCWAAFFVRYFPPTDPRCSQWREMVLHPSGDVSGMASDVMGNFGYTSGGAFDRTDAFNTAQKTTYGTDWAYTAYVAYNPSPAPAELTNGTSAFAYLRGPYTFLLYRSYGWAVDQVFTHESGHIYGACDEYLDSGCSCASICQNGVINGNCATCSNGGCMMKANTFNVCSYTDDHLGWQGYCTIPPLSPPVASAITPATGLQGTEVQVGISGSNFLYGAFAGFGAGVTLTDAQLVGSDSLLVTIAIDNTATPGARNVKVSNRDLQSSTLAGAFTVLQSTRHYASPAGGNVFPYVHPADAATTVGAALSAAGDGDSVLVEGTTIAASSFNVDKDVWLLGAWNAGFTARDVVSGRTLLQLTRNVSFVSGGSDGGIDGFTIEGGSGSNAPSPTSGTFGGGVRVELTGATIRNCEIRQCNATGGGGISVYQGDVTIENTYIHDNTAVKGGGVYLHSSSAVLTGNTITANDITQLSGTPEGAGVYVELCSGVSLDGNTIDDNIGAANGGGVLMRYSNATTIDGGSVSGNTASSNGGGMYIVGAGIDVSGVTVDHNDGFIGGGVALADTAHATFTHCNVTWNTALIAAGLYASAATVDVSHNLFVGNAASNTGGAVYLASPGGGVVAGNTIDRNAGPAGSGGIGLSSTSIEIYDNIVTNTTGIGIQCSGGAPLLSYNDVWNSSGGDYSGCTPGTGALSADPAFADTTALDYHLGLNSPAIDAGRPGFDDPDGSPGDMGRYGAHAFVMDQPAYPKNVVASLQSGSVIVHWDTSPEPDVDSYIVYCDTLSGFTPSAGNAVATVAAPDTSVDLGTPTDSTYYRVAAVDTSGYQSGYSAEAAAGLATAVAERIPPRTRLFQNVPNPFNPRTVIRYEVAHTGDVSLVVYDVTGRAVRRLVSGLVIEGPHSVDWDGRNDAGDRVSSGVYFYRLTTGTTTLTRKMIVLK